MLERQNMQKLLAAEVAKVSLEGLGTDQFLGKYVPGVSTSRL